MSETTRKKCVIFQSFFLDCGVLRVQYGELNTSDTVYGTTAKVTCDNGYKTGDIITTTSCTDTGEWSHFPSCVPLGTNSQFGVLLQLNQNNIFTMSALSKQMEQFKNSGDIVLKKTIHYFL